MSEFRSAGLAVLVTFALLLTGCSGSTGEHGWSDIDRAVELEARLAEADFSLVESNPEAVRVSWEKLKEEEALPEPWLLEFAGASVHVPQANSDTAVGIVHADGRLSVLYPFPDPAVPTYGEIFPLAIAHYMVPDAEVQVVLLLVCFQGDPQGGLAGVGVRSVSRHGRETGAPFALAVRPEELAGKFFYDEFGSMSQVHAVASRADWDRGVLLITRLAPDAVLSTYLPWY